jgi:hypothetical protein
VKEMAKLQDNLEQADFWVNRISARITDHPAWAGVNLEDEIRLAFTALSYCRLAEIGIDLSRIEKSVESASEQLARIADALTVIASVAK